MRPRLIVRMALLFALAVAGDALAQTSNMRFAAMDENRDGVITRSEWRGSDQSFRVHDWNGDGRLAGEEIRVGGQRRRNAEMDYDQARSRQFTDWTPEGFADHDHDRDGRIARDEWHYDLESFRRADRNRDGTLTRNEFLSTETDNDLEDRFEYLDANRNGQIERREWHSSPDAFEWLDRNGDDRLSRAEIVGEEAGDAPDLFEDLDYNRDRRVTMDEWHWSRRSFNRRDSNRDGMLTRQELSGADADNPAVGTSGRLRGRMVTVDASERWVDTGINVERGNRITLTAEGTVRLSTNGNDISTPAGSATGRRAVNAPLADQIAGALIARIGSSAPIFVGANATIDAPTSGRLYLSVNDDHLLDNTGSYQVTVAAASR